MAMADALIDVHNPATGAVIAQVRGCAG